MSEPTVPGDSTPDTTPTESLQLADQQPLPPAAAPAKAPSGNHTRTILEVVGGVVAAGLIVVAGVLGFAVGHATGDDRGGRGDFSRGESAMGSPDGGQPGQGFGQGQGGGQQGQGFGQDQRGVDPDGDNWTGQNRGFGDGQQMGPGQMMPGYGDDDGYGHDDGQMMPGFGQDQRGVDPDGDNWTGQNRQQDQQALPTTPTAPSDDS